MPFSPEQFMQADTDPADWAQLRSQSMARLGQTVGTRRREAEQTRQFDITAAETERQHDLTAMQQAAQLQFDRQKLANDIRQKQIERQIEGMKLIREADRQAEGVDDFNANRDKIARSHRILVTGDELTPEQAAQIAAEANAMPDPDAPPGTPPAQGAAPQGAPPAGGAAPVYEPDAMPGSEEGIGIPPGTVTTGAAVVAETGAMASGDMTATPPLDPEDATTLEEQEKAEKENPLVLPKQEVPAPEPHEEALKRLRKQKGAIEVEAESRSRTEGQIAADMERRARIIRDAGLSPVAEAVALNMARGALGLPQIPIPPLSIPDPTAPAEAQGTGELQIIIPPEIEALAKEPPQLQPDIVREAMKSGKRHYWDMDTGEYLGSDNWAETQKSRVEFRRQAFATLSSMATNQKEEQQIEVAVEAWARSRNEKAFDLLEAMLRLQGQRATAGLREEANDRAARAEQRAILADVEQQTTKLISEQRTNAQLDTMHENLQGAERSLDALGAEGGDRTSENALRERGVLARHLKSVVDGRASDQDARMALDTTFRDKVIEAWRFVASGGGLSDSKLQQLKDITQELYDQELEKAHKTAERLYETIYDNLTIMQLDPQTRDHQARQAIKRQIPELPGDVVDEIAMEFQKKERKPALGRVPNWSMGGSTSSSSSSSTRKRGSDVSELTNEQLTEGM